MTDLEKIELLATKVMGWEEGKDFLVRSDGLWKKTETGWWLWNPLQNIADAWMIVEKLVLECGLAFELTSSIREFRASFNGKEWSYSKTVQEAISNAAIKVVGVEVR